MLGCRATTTNYKFELGLAREDDYITWVKPKKGLLLLVTRGLVWSRGR